MTKLIFASPSAPWYGGFKGPLHPWCHHGHPNHWPHHFPRDLSCNLVPRFRVFHYSRHLVAMEFWIVNNSTLREFAFLYFFQCFLDMGLSTNNTGLRPSTLDISTSTWARWKNWKRWWSAQLPLSNLMPNSKYHFYYIDLSLEHIFMSLLVKKIDLVDS